MKKLSLLLLVLVLVCGLFVLTSCGGDTNTNTDSGSDNTDTSTGSQPDEDLAAAYDYVKLTYKTLNVTAASFEVMKNAPIGDKIFNISWSTDNDAITITESEDGTSYVVNVPELGDTAINYTLKFSIENDKGEKKMGSFNLTVPVFSVNTHDQYVAAEDGEALIVQGIVTGIMAKTHNTSTKEESLYLQDLSGNGGYYVYNSKTDLTNINVGMTVEVRGEKKNYNGTFELVNADVIVIDETIKTVTPVDFTDAVIGAASLDDKSLTNLNGMLVTIKGVTLLQYSESNGYHNFEIGNHKTYFRISTSSNCITEDDGRTLTSTFNNNFYNAADVTGIIAVYNSNMYLMPVSKDALTNIVAQEKPDDVQVDITLDNTTVPGMIQVAGDTTLPTTFSSLVGVSISWELVDGAGVATLNGATLTVRVPEEAKTVKLTATVTSGEVSKTKDYEIAVKPISTITIEEANNIGDPMASNNYTDEIYYITGIVESVANDTYGNLYLVDESGEFRIYIYGLYDSTGKVRYDKMDPKPLKGDTITVLSSVGKYNTDVQLKNAKVVEHTVHPDNEGAVVPDDYTEMTITEALAAEDNTKVKVSGTVISIDGVWNENFGNMNVTIADADGNELYIYRVTTKVEVGDIITVKGTLTTYNDKKQIGQGGTATIDGHDSSYDYVEMTISEALAAADGKNVIVVGTVSKIGTEYNSQYNNISVYIQDEAGNELYIYRLTGDVAVGTTIKVTGSMTTYSENRQLVGGTFEVVTNSGDSGDSGDTCEHTYTDGVCTQCGANDPDYVAAVTIAEALTKADDTKVKITGIIIKIDTPYSDQYNNITVTIADASGSTIQLYRLTGNFNVNDIITVTGLMDTYSGSRQIAQGATATKDGTHTCTEYTEATCQELAKCKECGVATGEKADHVYVDGTCSVCGHKEGEAEAVELSISFADTANRTTFTTSQQIWEQNGIKVTNDKASSSSNVADYANPARFYKSSSLLVEVTGKTITKIVFNCNNASYATALNGSIVAAEGVTVSVSGSDVTVEFASPVDSFAIASLTGGQVRMNGITVYCL